jgi:hypothetical protein
VGVGLLSRAGRDLAGRHRRLFAVVAAYLVALVSSYRLMVEPGVLRLRWLGGERSYRLVRGSVTRVA